MVPPVPCPLCSLPFPPDQVAAHASGCGLPPSTGPRTAKRKVVEEDLSTEKKVMAPLFVAKKPRTEESPKAKNNKEATKNKEIHKTEELVPKDPKPAPGAPLAERMRPRHLTELLGQPSALGPGSALRALLSSPSGLPSLLLWGPPGCGKTSLANVIAESCKAWARFVKMSACTAGVAEVREVVVRAKNEAVGVNKRRTILFMDEVHRFNKAQQDSFLPHIESGVIILIGATTENPSFSLNSALLSRCRVVVLEKLEAAAVMEILGRALEEQEAGVEVAKEALEYLAEVADGDARRALNSLETVVRTARAEGRVEATVEQVKEAVGRASLAYDRRGDQHYAMASALQKAIRGGSDSGALYWLGRMLRGGEDPVYVGRRLVRTAAEDVGLADPGALQVAVAALQGVQLLGMPECDVLLAEAAVYLARAPKSQEVYQALARVYERVDSGGQQPEVPDQLRNATSKLTRELGWGRGYSAKPEVASGLEYLPVSLRGVDFFKP